MPNDRKREKKERRAKRKRRKAERERKRQVMKRIEIPASIMLKGMDGNESNYPFKTFLRVALESNEIYGKGLANIRRGMKLLKIVEDQCKGSELILENADFEDIKKSIDSVQWLTPLVVQMGTYLDAVENAKTFAVKKTPPKEGEKKASGKKAGKKKTA